MRRGRVGTPALSQLSKAGIGFQVVEYSSDPDARGEGYGLEAVAALGVDPAIVCKTLLAELQGGELVVAVIPVEFQLDSRALAKAAGAKKATIANSSVAERRTGYVLGGISPFGQRFFHRTFVDRSVEGESEVFVSGGRRGLEVVVPASAFATVLQATFLDLLAAG